MIQLIFIFGRVCNSHYTISEIRFETRGFLKSVIKNIKYQIMCLAIKSTCVQNSYCMTKHLLNSCQSLIYSNTFAEVTSFQCSFQTNSHSQKDSWSFCRRGNIYCLVVRKTNKLLTASCFYCILLLSVGDCR